MYTLLLALIYLAFISLGLPDSLLGAGWPAMYGALDVPISSMGIVSMIISGGTVASSLMSNRLTHRFGTRVVTVASVFLTAAALLGFSVSSRFWMLVLFAIPYGLGAGAIDAALNNYVALHYAPRHMSWLHCFWGVGAIISPLFMSYALTHSDWHGGYRAVGLLQLGIALVLLVTLPVWNIHRRGAADGGKPLGLAGALRIKGVLTLLLALFSDCALETVTTNWASTYMVAVKGVTAEVAARFASLFYIGIAAGRFLSGFVMSRLGDRNMIRLGTGVLACGIALLPLPAANPAVTFAGFILIGLGCAPIYPSIIHSTPDNFGAENSGAIIGILMAGAYIGSTFMPPLYGLLGSFAGFRILPLYLAALAVLMIVMAESTFRTAARRGGRGCA